MSENRRGNDWKEWSQHVLIELKRLNEEQKSMNETLGENTESLKVHIKRTDILEEMYADHKKDTESRLRPVEEHVVKVAFLGKLVLAFVAVPACVYYIAQLIRMMMGKI